MKSPFQILLLFLFLTCCNHNENEHSEHKKTNTEISSNSYLENFQQPDFVNIKIDSFKNFGELVKKMQELSCAKKSIGLNFNQNDTIFKLTGWADCPNSGINSCYFNRNTMVIKNDSVKNYSGDFDKLKHIKNLGNEISKISTINYHFQYNKNILRPAIIHLYIENSYPIAKTKEVLKQVVKEFKKVNYENEKNFFRYNIIFESYNLLNIPPPPPNALDKIELD
ncbi:hypothetical protein [Maribacter sp.]|uniref:hypothetical protein n=1 Tax=Maribacter sp. TaxID=1897614 RepID=UPI0025BE7934|nr:hypothetical protein [Maribacter sp.]